MTITVKALYERVQNDPSLVWIDVRTTDEFKAERPNTPIVKNLPLDQINTFSCPKDQDVYVSCRSGKRSQAAKNILIASGYNHVFNVTGGFIAWESENLPVIR